MNRLKNYLDCRKIAEAYLDTGLNRAAKHEYDLAIAAVIKGIRYLITANNNLQSLAFNQKPKRRKNENTRRNKTRPLV